MKTLVDIEVTVEVRAGAGKCVITGMLFSAARSTLGTLTDEALVDRCTSYLRDIAKGDMDLMLFSRAPFTTAQPSTNRVIIPGDLMKLSIISATPTVKKVEATNEDEPN